MNLLKTHPLTITKLFSLILAVVFFEFFKSDFLIALFILGLSHYVVAAIYSVNGYKALAPLSKRILFLFIALGPILFLIDYKVLMVWVFGAHYVLTEVYVCHSNGNAPKSSDTNNLNRQSQISDRWLKTARFILGGLVYFITFRKSYNPLDWSNSDYMTALMISTVFYFYCQYRRADQIQSQLTQDTTVFDLLTVAVGVFMLNQGFVKSSHDVFWPPLYHFIFWLIYPYLIHRPAFNLKKYSVTNVYSTLIVMVLTLPFYWTIELKGLPMVLYFIGGYSHILSSLVISRLNPQIVIRYLQYTRAA